MVLDTRDIRNLRQWLCWRAEERDGKPTKIPYSPLTGERAKSTDPRTWASYEEAVQAYKKHGYSGLGFAFTPEAATLPSPASTWRARRRPQKSVKRSYGA